MKKEKLQIKSKISYNPIGAKLTMFYQNHCVEIYDGIYMYDEPVDDYLHKQAMILCASTTVDFGEGPINLIVYDSKFKKCPKIMQEYAINHEIGHIINGDFKDMKKLERENKKRLLGILPDMEVQADLHAALVMGPAKVKHIMKYMMLNTDLPLGTKIELFRRYNRIK